MGSAGKQSVDEPGGPGSGHTPDESGGFVSDGRRLPLDELSIFIKIIRATRQCFVYFVWSAAIRLIAPKIAKIVDSTVSVLAPVPR